MADPTLNQVLQMIQTSYYVTAAGGALVAYDQVLTFSQEVDLIWKRNWSLTTVLYLIARYSGSLCTIATAAWNMRINWTYSSYVNIYLVVNWTSNIFLLSMQAILLIRIYALFNRSKKVLVFLATLYVIQVTIVFVAVGLLLNNRATHQYLVSISPAYGSVTQVVTSNTPAFLAEAHASTILSAVCDVILLFFALWAFVRHAREAKTLHGGWSINVLVRTMVTDHLLYYVCYVIWLSLSLATNYITNLTASSALLTDVLDFCNALAVVAGPRMVISLRSMENKTRGEGETMDVELSTIRFDIQEPPTKSESVMQEAGF